MNRYYIPPRRPPIENVLNLARVALAAYNAGLLGGEPAKMRKAEREALESSTSLAEIAAAADYGGQRFVSPTVSSGYDYTAEPQAVVSLADGTPSALSHVPGLKERELRVREGTLAQARRAFDIEQSQVPAYQRAVTAGEFAAIEASMPQVDAQLGFAFSKAAPGYMNTMKNLTEQGLVKRDLYEYSRNNWNHLKQPFIEAARKEMATAAKNNDMKKVAQLKASIDLLDKPDFLDLFYPNSARAREAELAERQTDTDRLLRAQLGQVDSQIKETNKEINRAELEIAKLDPEFDTEAVTRLEQEKKRLVDQRRGLYGYKKAMGGTVPDEFLREPEKGPSPEETQHATQAATLVRDFKSRYPNKAAQAEKIITGKRKWTAEEVEKVRIQLEALKPKKVAMPKPTEKPTALKDVAARAGGTPTARQAKQQATERLRGILDFLKKGRRFERRQTGAGSFTDVTEAIQRIIRQPEPTEGPWYAK